MNKLKLVIIMLFTTFLCSAQEIIKKPTYLRFPSDTILKHKLYASIDSLFLNLNNNLPLEKHLLKKDKLLTKYTLNVFKEYHLQFKKDTTKTVVHQLSNIYPINNKNLVVNISGIVSRKGKSPVLLYQLKLITNETKTGFKFSIPLRKKTQYWKTKTIGKITYHYRNVLNTKRAMLFDKKNKKIAQKFNLAPEKLTMYMCNNYQEILQLRGISYSVNENGLYRDGYGVVDNTIFSVMNNEGFSHDMLHYYSGKVNNRENRNWVTEEGLAYLWGNAYYTDAKGEMITQKKLVLELKKYLKHNYKTNLYDVFYNDTKIYNHIAPEVSVQSVIAGVIANEIEKKQGVKNVIKLINAGSKDRKNNFLNMIKELLNINKDNFHKKVVLLLKTY